MLIMSFWPPSFPFVRAVSCKTGGDVASMCKERSKIKKNNSFRFGQKIIGNRRNWTVQPEINGKISTSTSRIIRIFAAFIREGCRTGCTSGGSGQLLGTNLLLLHPWALTSLSPNPPIATPTASPNLKGFNFLFNFHGWQVLFALSTVQE